jgi:hypothetical protein
MKINLPTSIGGLNLRDSFDNMPMQDAIQMDNVIPDVNSDKVRSGCTAISRPEGESEYGALNLMTYNFGLRQELLSATDDTIYLQNLADFTREELATGFSSADWKQASFTDGAGNVSVFLANGFDTPQRVYESTGDIVVEDATYTGLPTQPLESPMGYKNRMYFVEKNTFNIWYGGVDSIGGALSEFPVSAVFSDGGYIANIANWTQDAGDGTNNLFAIFSTEGEVAIYSGSNPATDFSIIGVYKIARPIGKRCTQKLAGDLIVITEQGFMPLSNVLNADQSSRVAISDKINKIVDDKDINSNWSIHWYSKEGWLLINIPSTDTGYQYEQVVLNYKTGAWCRFVGLDSLHWAILGNNIYFCNESGIFKANDGNEDDGEPIRWFVQKAYNNFNDSTVVKQVTRLKIRDNSQGQLTLGKRIGVDFSLSPLSYATDRESGEVTYWDEAKWDTSFWSQENQINQFKSSIISRAGNFISIGLFGETTNNYEIYSTEVNYNVGNGDV